jgi:hypothetical protein
MPPVPNLPLQQSCKHPATWEAPLPSVFGSWNKQFSNENKYNHNNNYVGELFIFKAAVLHQFRNGTGSDLLAQNHRSGVESFTANFIINFVNKKQTVMLKNCHKCTDFFCKNTPSYDFPDTNPAKVTKKFWIRIRQKKVPFTPDPVKNTNKYINKYSSYLLVYRVFSLDSWTSFSPASVVHCDIHWR